MTGSLVAFLGLFALPFVWVMALFAFCANWPPIPLVRAIVTGVGATGAGIFIGTAIKLGRRNREKPAYVLVLIAACFLVRRRAAHLAHHRPAGRARHLAVARRGRL